MSNVMANHYRQVFQHSLVQKSGYFNYGWWTFDIRNSADASERLVDELWHFGGGNAGNQGPRILDVACGVGACSSRIAQLSGGDVLGVNVDGWQVEVARKRFPGLRFEVMDAVRLEAEAESFDVITCVEAAFHFRARKDFLREAFRVLRPGGRLLIADVLFGDNIGLDEGIFPKENCGISLSGYNVLLGEAGFQRGKTQTLDVTSMTWKPFREQLARAVLSEEYAPEERKQLVEFIITRSLNVQSYVFVGARKP